MTAEAIAKVRGGGPVDGGKAVGDGRDRLPHEGRHWQKLSGAFRVLP